MKPIQEPSPDGFSIPLFQRLSKISYVQFDKDSLVHPHMLFITSASNLRAQNYSIPLASADRVKRIASELIPAVATSTAFLSASLCSQLYTTTRTLPFQPPLSPSSPLLSCTSYTNSVSLPPPSIFRTFRVNLNIARILSLSSPKPRPLNPPQPETVWDTYVLVSPFTPAPDRHLLTLQDVFEFVEMKRGWKVSVVMCEDRTLYSETFMKPDMKEERIRSTLLALGKRGGGRAGGEAPASLKLIIMCTDGEDDSLLDFPTVIIQFKDN